MSETTVVSEPIGNGPAPTGTMQAAVVTEPNAPWELQERAIPHVGPNDVLVRIRACGICGTDMWMATGTLSFHPFPLQLGHEGVGEIVAVGDAVTTRKVGDRVGVFMVQKNCGVCDFCHEEHFPLSFVIAGNCANPTLTGVTVDGAHAEYIAVHEGGSVLLPAGNVPYEILAPTLCSGYTVWAGLRSAEPKPGARIAVVGIGALGHLAIQFAKAAGYHVTAVTHSPEKHELARELGADQVVADGKELKAAGGADVLMHTSSSHAYVSRVLEGLSPWGTLVLSGIAMDDMTIPGLDFLINRQKVVASAHNGIEYLVEALGFVGRGEVKPMIEVFPKERVGEAYAKVLAGEVRFKAVVTY